MRRKPKCGRTDGQTEGRTDGRTDGHGDSNIPPLTSLWGYNYDMADATCSLNVGLAIMISKLKIYSVSNMRYD